MKLVDPTRITGYRDSHTVFEHAYEGSHKHRAQFAVRRVVTAERNETQIEAKLESTPVSYGGKATRTSTQHMSICIPPAEAIAFALAIAPELAEAVRELKLLNLNMEGGQRENTPAGRLIASIEAAS